MKKIILMCVLSVFILGIFSTANAAKTTSKSKADLNQSLIKAFKNRDLKQAAALVKQGADVNTNIIEGTQPIHYAAGMGDIDFLKLLISKGADVNAINTISMGGTALTIDNNKNVIEFSWIVLKSQCFQGVCNDIAFIPCRNQNCKSWFFVCFWIELYFFPKSQNCINKSWHQKKH